jgi:general secretion pathway protein B
MSYILEALKKSELERQQRRLPDLISAPVRIGQPEEEKPRFRAGLAIGAVLLVAGTAFALGWWFVSLPPGSKPLPTATVAQQASPAESPSQAPQPLPERPKVLVAEGNTHIDESVGATAANRKGGPEAPSAPSAAARAPIVSHAAPEPGVDPVPPWARPASSVTSPTRPAVPSGASSDQGEKGAGPKPDVSMDAPPAAAATRGPNPAVPREAPLPAPSKRVTSFAELPSSIKKSLPRISVAGYSFADDGAMRMVVINDRILREGEEVSAGVTLERIDGDGKLTLNYKGFRFRPPQ